MECAREAEHEHILGDQRQGAPRGHAGAHPGERRSGMCSPPNSQPRSCPPSAHVGHCEAMSETRERKDSILIKNLDSGAHEPADSAIAPLTTFDGLARHAPRAVRARPRQSLALTDATQSQLTTGGQDYQVREAIRSHRPRVYLLPDQHAFVSCQAPLDRAAPLLRVRHAAQGGG